MDATRTVKGGLFVSQSLYVKDMKRMPLPTAYFSSKRPRDVDVSQEPYTDIDFTNTDILFRDVHSY